MTTRAWHGEVRQDGIVVVKVDAANYESVYREILRYWALYAQEGPCEVRVKEHRPRKPKQ
jgi:hypothetical protein